MAHGDNHAKQIVIDEATRLADKLQNDKAGCAETQGKAVALLVKMITPLYEAEFMTVEECERVHQNSNGSKKIARLKLKIGPIQVEGPLTSAILVHIAPIACCILCVFTLGKVQNWW